MIPKRVRQFYMNLTDGFTREDRKYAESILDDFEMGLFEKLSGSEKKHSVRVSKEFLNISREISDGNFEKHELFREESEYTEKLQSFINDNGIECVKRFILDNRDMLIKTGLLHDVGKSVKRINIIDKSIIVILNKITSGRLRAVKYSKVQCYYRHSEYSFNMLKDYIKNDEMLYIIENHHIDTEDMKLLVFQVIDDRN